MNLTITLAIITFTYFGIALGRWPKIESNRATVTLMAMGLSVFFAGLFIVSGTLEANGITTMLFQTINLTSNTGIWAFSFVTAGLRNLVSNVSAVLLLKSIAASFRDPTAGWLTLTAASTLAGNLTLLGSVANLIVAEIAARWRVDLNFWEYTRVGLVITLFSLTLGTLWLQIFFW